MPRAMLPGRADIYLHEIIYNGSIRGFRRLWASLHRHGYKVVAVEIRLLVEAEGTKLYGYMAQYPVIVRRVSPAELGGRARR